MADYLKATDSPTCRPRLLRCIWMVPNPNMVIRLLASKRSRESEHGFETVIHRSR